MEEYPPLNLIRIKSPKKIDISRSPIKRIRKTEDENNDRNVFSPEESPILNNNGENTSRKSVSLLVYKGRTRGFSQKIKRYNKLADMIVSDIGTKEDCSETPTILNKNEIKPTCTYKSNKLFNRFNFNKRKKFRKKKVKFKRKFVEVIEVENYKKYNLNDYLNDSANSKCSCLVY